jgi:diguanylate cyclase (GGDEF)-like protein
VKLKTSQSRYADDRYSVQRRLGFPWLRFLPELEHEYRENYVGINATRMRSAAFIGLFGVVGFLILDNFVGSNLLPPTGDYMLMLVTLPAAVVPVLLTFRARSPRLVLPVIFVATMIAALSILEVINIGRQTNAWFPYEALFLVVIYIYFVSGLTFYRAIAAGVILMGAFVWTNWALRAHDKLLYEAFYLLLANGIGVIGHYLLERQSRVTFLLFHELEQQAVLDPLTGLMNRRAFNARLETIWRQARRNMTPVGILIVDLDDFKQINDTCGHQFGDSALAHVATVLRSCATRPLDAAARYGGDEFVAVWYDVDGAWFHRLIEELPERLCVTVCGVDGAQGKVTVSGGAVLAWPRPDLESRHAIKAADDLLYVMKRGSRGRVGHTVLNTAQGERKVA